MIARRPCGLQVNFISRGAALLQYENRKLAHALSGTSPGTIVSFTGGRLKSSCSDPASERPVSRKLVVGVVNSKDKLGVRFARSFKTASAGPSPMI